MSMCHVHVPYVCVYAAWPPMAAPPRWPCRCRRAAGGRPRCTPCSRAGRRRGTCRPAAAAARCYRRCPRAARRSR
eukprot:scaffold141407_cov163-Phaeocystis_antarctica.AAC.1